MFIGVVGWFVVGLLVGFIASKMVNLRGDDPIGGIGSAVAGAFVGAVLYTVISGAGVSAWNIWSIFYAALGAIAGAATWHLVRSRYVSRASQSYRRSY
ncbi:MAG TPA: hypothetical protein VF669_16025 [Tepidisphaeraceae bacterium]|jgi:uncharacterized membrane protein YeaQ/YmgE (transglycosylase-associated protein family)